MPMNRAPTIDELIRGVPPSINKGDRAVPASVVQGVIQDIDRGSKQHAPNMGRTFGTPLPYDAKLMDAMQGAGAAGRANQDAFSGMPMNQIDGSGPAPGKFRTDEFADPTADPALAAALQGKATPMVDNAALNKSDAGPDAETAADATAPGEEIDLPTADVPADNAPAGNRFQAANKSFPDTSQYASAAPNKTGASPGGTYTIKKGDTLWDIAKAVYGDPMAYKKIAAANRIRNPSMIYAGATIHLPV